MNIKQLECFVELSKSGNFTRTAESLFISQPALSRSIGSLEEELSTTLFIRSKRTSRLTSSGEIALESATKIMDAYHEMLTALKMERNGCEGKLTLGVLGNALGDFFPTLLTSFSENYPNVKVVIKDYNVAEMVNAINGLTIDCGLVSSDELSQISGVELISIGKSPLCVAIHESNPLAHRSSVAMSELQNESFVFLDPSVSFTAYKNTLNHCMKSGFSPKMTHKMHSIYAAISMVECNQGVFVLPAAAFPLKLETVKYVPIDGMPKMDHLIAWRTENCNPAIKVFSAMVRDAVGKTSFFKDGSEFAE